MPGEQNSSRSSPQADEIVTIVRYPNRRLYDRSQARYVTLQEIATMVREGKTVNVRDSKSNDDLTSSVLLQIILENHPERMDLLPVPVLHLMIRTNDMVLGLLRDYFRQSTLYLEFWQQAARFNPMASSMEWLKSLVPSTAGVSTQPASGPSPADALRERLADLESRLDALKPSTEKTPQSTSPSGPESPEQAKPGRPKRVRSGRNRRKS